MKQSQQSEQLSTIACAASAKEVTADQSIWPWHLRWLVPLASFLLLAPWTPELDQQLSAYFYEGENRFASGPFVEGIYRWGIVPAQLVAAAAFFLWMAARRLRLPALSRTIALYLMAVMALGPGLTTQILCKELWPRPRPRQIELFGGAEPFHAWWTPSTSQRLSPFGRTLESGKSFPSGHATMGFYFFACALAARQAGRIRLERLSWTIAWLLGALLGYARIAQGGHFFSDVVAAALIVWLSSWLLQPLFFTKTKYSQ